MVEDVEDAEDFVEAGQVVSGSPVDAAPLPGRLLVLLLAPSRRSEAAPGPVSSEASASSVFRRLWEHGKHNVERSWIARFSQYSSKAQFSFSFFFNRRLKTHLDRNVYDECDSSLIRLGINLIVHFGEYNSTLKYFLENCN